MDSSRAATVGGVQTNFRMPDVVAVGLGGGTIISTQGRIKIGPQSVGYRLSEEALSFGGEQFTLSDHAILSGKMSIPEAADEEILSAAVETNTSQKYEDLQAAIQASIQDAVNQLVDKVKTDSKAVPAILVGGGSPILPEKIEGISEIITPEHYEVANAYGACISQIGGEAEKVFSLTTLSREEVIEQVKQLAIDNAIQAGADEETIEVLTINDTPLAYLPNALKVKVKVCGNLKM
ncbi:MAG: hydantoinase/oxoprolinase family protein [Bacteroidota bacterium]